MRIRARLLASIIVPLLVFPLLVHPPKSHAQAPAVSAEERTAFHRDPGWLLIAPHLPDPKTATAAQLEDAADVLRARRFPEDALDYYGYALTRGGSVNGLLNKMGVLRLELHQNDLAHELFKRTVRERKKDPIGWNNLGVTEYMDKNYSAAIKDYRRASQLNKTSAVYHINLGMAYFESSKMDASRKEFAIAVKLDPHVFDPGTGGGLNVQIVGSQNFGQLAFQMAKMYALRHDDASTILWLGKATEAGFDTRHEMPRDEALVVYAKDPRVLLMWKNADEMKARAVAGSAPVESLGPASANGRVN